LHDAKRPRTDRLEHAPLRGVVPPGAVYVGRAQRWVGLPASKWANPFTIGRDGTRDEVIEKYRAWIVQQQDLKAALHELRGKTPACWCAPERCHADVLLEMANA
jgi:hypothetical protein